MKVLDFLKKTLRGLKIKEINFHTNTLYEYEEIEELKFRTLDVGN